MNTTNTTDPCIGEWPQFTPSRAPLALRDNDLLYHSFGPFSDFGAPMSGCCRANVEIYDPGPAPLGCYYYCMFEPDGTQEQYAEIRDCIVGRAYEYRNELEEEQNVTGWSFLADGRSPGQISAAAPNLPQTSKFCIWRLILLGLAFAGGIVGLG